MHARSRWSAWAKRPWSEEEGQSTLEYMLVLAGTIAIVVALAALVAAGEKGILAARATGSASHALGGWRPADALLDVLMF